MDLVTTLACPPQLELWRVFGIGGFVSLFFFGAGIVLGQHFGAQQERKRLRPFYSPFGRQVVLGEKLTDR